MKRELAEKRQRSGIVKARTGQKKREAETKGRGKSEADSSISSAVQMISVKESDRGESGPWRECSILGQESPTPADRKGAKGEERQQP
jgi:hypothetical protein